MKLRTPSRPVMALLVGVVLLAGTTIFTRTLIAERSNDERTAKLVSKMVERYHISQEQIDDEISERMVDRYIDSLDGNKLYFFASDVEEFKRHKHELDDQIEEGQTQFAYDVFDRFLKRIDERIAYAHKMVDTEHDFTAEESFVTDADEVDWAKNEAEINERWRLRVKNDILALKVEDTPMDEIRDRLHKRYRNIRVTMIQTSDTERLEMYLTALTQSFDPHSSYMSPETLQDFRISMSLELEGIGAALRNEDGYTVVAQIVPGGAAEKDGRLKVGDKIIGVGQGEDGEIEDIVEMKLSRVVRKIRGKKDTKVQLQVKKEKSGEIVVYTLTRQKIELKSSEVKGEVIKTTERFGGGENVTIGVLNIPSFYRDFQGAQNGLADFKSTARDVKKVLKDFRDQGVDLVVVDLRYNGGGALSEAIEVSGLFIDEGPVVQVKDQNGRIKSHDDDQAGAAWTGPLVVITNRLSASASEIFAGVIKDYNRGIIVGDEATHGKGTVQNVMMVSNPLFQLFPREQQDLGALKLTINQFYRVNGDSTQNHGVKSDVVLPSLFDHMDLGEAFLDNALKFDQIRSDEYDAVDMVNPEMVKTLAEGSKQRVSQDEGFREVQSDIERYISRKNRKSVSLVESVVRAEREEDKQREDDEEDETDDDGNGPIFPEDHYNDEVLKISLDYLNLLKDAKVVER